MNKKIDIDVSVWCITSFNNYIVGGDNHGNVTFWE